MDEPVLWCKDLRKRFKERLAVDGVGFEVAPGETYGLLGPNGAGKTTTISMVCGLLRRDGGEVTVAGVSLDDDPGRVKAAIGYVPQDVALYPDLSGLENLRFWGRMYGLTGRDLERRVAETLEVVGLTDRAGDKVADYSGGMERRLNIAAGLLHRPRLLVLDEPKGPLAVRSARRPRCGGCPGSRPAPGPSTRPPRSSRPYGGKASQLPHPGHVDAAV
jgi:ABC-2 type transport system ATP-binding protein